MVWQFRSVLLDVRKRTIEALLLTGEQHKPDRATRFLARAHDRFGGSKRRGGSRNRFPFAPRQTPRIKIPPHDKKLFGALPAAGFPHKISRIYRAAPEPS